MPVDLSIADLPPGAAAGTDEVPVSKAGVTTKVTAAAIASLAAGVPLGVICMWGGLLANIPAGWQLCNGTNGTPDLRDRFIKGATSNPGATGGSVNHTHAAHTGVVNHTHPVTDPGHVHVENSNNVATGALRGWAAPDTSTNTPTATGYSTASAVTGVTTTNPAGGVASLTHDTVGNEPPFYVLAYIQKVA